MNRPVLYLALVLLTSAASALSAQSAALRGSREKMVRQSSIADSSEYPLLQTAEDVEQYAQLGVLVVVEPTADLQLAKVSFAVTRPEVRTFVRRLARQYHDACGQPLVVTSLTRPLDEQPNNASELSVHPAGMAVDIRPPSRRSCRRWLERKLLSLQDEGVLDATRERKPAHYHVAVYAQRYLAMLEQTGGVGDDAAPAVAAPPDATATARSLASADRQARSETYRVQRGDTLRRIAARHGISVALLKRANRIRGSRIAPGQVLRIPVDS